MLNISEHEAFRLKNGELLWSLEELKSRLPAIPDEVFSYHISNPKNDFSNWIEGVFGKSDLAKSIRKIKTKKSFIKRLEEDGI